VSPSSTPLASAKVNHDDLKIELVEPGGMPSSGSPGRHSRQSSKPSVFPMSQPRSRSCSRGRTLCSPQSGRSGDCNRVVPPRFSASLFACVERT
jgi:hypothetical protein